MFIPEVRLEQIASFTTLRETFARVIPTLEHLHMTDLLSTACSTNSLHIERNRAQPAGERLFVNCSPS